MKLLPPTVVYSRAALLTLLALLSGVPVAVHLTGSFHTGGGAVADPWIYPVVVLSVLQIAYAVYSIQVRDPRVSRVLVIVLATLAVAYSLLCGLATGLAWETRFVQAFFHGLVVRLQLTEEVFSGSAAPWCGAMAGTYGLTAYFIRSSKA